MTVRSNSPVMSSTNISPLCLLAMTNVSSPSLHFTKRCPSTHALRFYVLSIRIILLG